MNRVWVLCTAMLVVLCLPAFADSTFVYAVQLSATTQSSPPRVDLTWPADPYGAVSYTVSRKLKHETSWGAGVTLPGTATSYSDSATTAGMAYEYQVFKVSNPSLNYTGYGYIFAGIQLPPIENRGRVVLVVETNATAGLTAELSRLELDLIGDGWTVARKNVSSNQSPASVKSLITAEYFANPQIVKAVLLFGRVPVFFSGNLNWDTHGGRPLPADGFYGDMDGDWSGSPDFFPSAVELMVGRVDLAGMPGIGAASPWPSETDLLRNYLNKDHRWRHRQMVVQSRSLMGNRRGDEGGGAAASSGYRNFETFTGHGNTIEANIQDNAPLPDRWISKITSGTWLWAYGCGGGFPVGLSGLGTHPPYNDVYSTDLRDVGGGAKAVFYMLFGSWLADWQKTDSFIRATLATADYGLAACLAGRPQWFNHHVGLGDPIGYGARITMNNTTLYRSFSNGFAGGTYISLLGDPTLRLHVVGPPGNISASVNGGTVQLNWPPSADSVSGYHLYRSPAGQVAFARLTSAPIAALSFTDSPGQGHWRYMVRALKLELCPSGSYYNLSQGMFADASSPGGPSTNSTPILVRAVRSNQGPLLIWNSEPGALYRVQGNLAPIATGWVTLTGPFGSGTTNCSWTDPNGFALARGFYRVLREP
ncbi:MAG TPA: hypothetical protein VN673_17845 [Clostridia bacterium]|nr:hypothetical protein [Clostridia bacterium]